MSLGLVMRIALERTRIQEALECRWLMALGIYHNSQKFPVEFRSWDVRRTMSDLHRITLDLNRICA